MSTEFLCINCGVQTVVNKENLCMNCINKGIKIKSDSFEDVSKNTGNFDIGDIIVFGIIIIIGLVYFDIIIIGDPPSLSEFPTVEFNTDKIMNIGSFSLDRAVDDNVEIEKDPEMCRYYIQYCEFTIPWDESGLTDEEILEIENEIEILINIERGKHGLGPLVGNELLREVAYYHSLDMAINNYFDHVSKNGDGPRDRGIKLGYICEKEIRGLIYDGISENIHIIPSGLSKNQIAFTVVDGWMESPGHRENLLTPELVYGEIAIAVSYEGTFPASTFVGAFGHDGKTDINSPALLITHNFAVCRP